jgi:hypothetical protein
MAIVCFFLWLLAEVRLVQPWLRLLDFNLNRLLLGEDEKLVREVIVETLFLGVALLDFFAPENQLLACTLVALLFDSICQ